jgi:hypothetical protein
VHTRLVPGFVLDARLDGKDRIVLPGEAAEQTGQLMERGIETVRETPKAG